MVEDVLRTASAGPAGTERARLRRPWWTRLSRAHVAMIVAALAAGGLNLLALGAGDARTPVLVAATALDAGAVLDETAVEVSAVAGDVGLLRALVPADRVEQRRGWVLVRPLRAGEPLRWTDLRDPAASDGLRAISLPVEPEHAVGGVLRPGDRVDVVAVREGQAMWLVSGVEVLGVAGGDTDALGGPSPYALTLAVSELEALRLAWAMHDGAVEVVRATGAPPLAQPAAVQGDTPPATSEVAQ